MKVYAEFIQEKSLNYRTRTILQFGDSWDLIGSIVMKNPGSAFPTKMIDIKSFEEIQSRYATSDLKNSNWFEFTPDPTMGQVEKIFNGDYVSNPFELSGVIQIFNLFNIREQNIQKAKALAENNDSVYLYPDVNEVKKLFCNRPVYLAWRWEYLQINKSFAENIFEYVKASKFMYLENDIIDNHFYHPGYINRSYSKEIIQKPLRLFRSFFNK